MSIWILSLRNAVSQQVKRKNIYEQCSKTHVLSRLLLARVRSISSSSSVSVVNSSQIQNPSSSAAASVKSYLINSGELSENEAISVSKKPHFETTSKSDSVLSLLETYGFSDSYISKLITKRPSILSSEPEVAIKPKFDFFKSKGLSGIELAKFICSDPRILIKSLPTQIIPVFDTLKNIVRCDENVLTVLRRHPRILGAKSEVKNIMVNIELLRDEGVPQSNISKLLINQPRVLTRSTGRFKEIVEEIKDRGFDPYKTAYLGAIQVTAGLSRSNLQSRMYVYRRWGWSEEEIRSAFIRQPQCMRTSEKKIMSTMDYLVNQMGWNSSLIANCPVVLNRSLEKRIMPRCSVYRILTTKGLVKNQVAMSSLLIMSEKSFSAKFVKEYAQKVPELLKVYHGKFIPEELPNSSTSGRLSEGK